MNMILQIILQGHRTGPTGKEGPAHEIFYEDIRGEGGAVMLLRTISILIMGLISFALFLALSEIGDATGMPFPAQVSNR